MHSYTLSHLSDQALLRDLAALLARDRATTAELLAHLAEVDTRRLYLPAGYPSMFAYCADGLHLSEDAAYKRIQAARAAWQFPALYAALAAGRLHLAAVVLLAPHLTGENAGELLEAAAGKRKAEIEQMLAQRFPRPELPAMVRALPLSAPRPSSQLAPGQVGRDAAPQLAPEPVEVPAMRPKVTPLAPRRFALQLTMSQAMHDKLRHAQELLGHQIPSGDVAQVLERALDALIPQLEKRKFAATGKPGPRRPTNGVRHVPARVKRAVWERDQGRCTFVGESGQRCPARTRLEFDHVREVARGGQATVAGIRLRCRVHNQYGAERAFGTEFMRHKRREARRVSSRGEAAPDARGS